MSVRYFVLHVATKSLRKKRLSNWRASWVVGRGSCVVGRGSWVVGRGSWVVGRGSWVVGRGSCVYKPSYQLSLDFKFTEKCVTLNRAENLNSLIQTPRMEVLQYTLHETTARTSPLLPLWTPATQLATQATSSQKNWKIWNKQEHP